MFDGLRTMSLPKLLWGIILTVALSLLVNLILYLVEELVKNEKRELMRLAIIRTQTKKLGILLNFLALKNAPFSFL